MNKFYVKDVEAAPSVQCTHEDLGLCYVSRFHIGPLKFYSVVSQADNPNNYADIRREQAKKDIAERGYIWNGVME